MSAKNWALAAAASLVVTVLAVALVDTAALAGKSDYAFEPVAAEVKKGAGSEIAVRLTHKPSGKPVQGAIIFRSRLDMSPDAMGEMTTEHKAQPAKEPGVYRFNTVIFKAK